MRTHRTAASLSLILLAGACSTKETPKAGVPDDLSKDLAAAAATSNDFAAAPKNFQPTRFVSDVERYKGTAPLKATASIKRPSVTRAAISQPATQPTVDLAPAPVATEVAATTAPVATDAAPVLDNAVGDAPPPYHGPTSAPAPAGAGSEVITDRGDSGGGLGGMLGGLGAVIRGGHVGVDKCDPRRDGRRPTINGRPGVGEPLPVTPPSTFPGRGRNGF